MLWMASEFPLASKEIRPGQPCSEGMHRAPVPSLGFTVQPNHIRRGQGVEDQSTAKQGFENWERRN